MKLKPVLSASVGLCLCGAATAVELKLRIMETTDVHMNPLSYDYYQDKATDQYGLSRAVTLIRAARSQAENSMMFDNGDLLQGSPMGDVVAKVRPLQDGQAHPAGAEVLEWLEMSAGPFNQIDSKGAPEQAVVNTAFPSFNFDTIECWWSTCPCLTHWLLAKPSIRLRTGIGAS